MVRRPAFLAGLFLLLALVSGGLYAQMESGDRGILPLDSSGTLEINGIHVDVGGPNAAAARFAGWRIAQREGFKALWAKTHKRPANQAPNLPDSTLDGLVSSIIIEREQIGPSRYIADLGLQFDRGRAAELLGVEGAVRRSAPMLLIPVTITGGTATAVELRNPWQRAWAEFRTAQSPIDYVRVSGMSIDPLLINAAQTRRPGRGWWRNLIDLYGASDILIAETVLHRAYPGGPATARFIARHGPDGEIIGGFRLTAADGNVQRLMREGAARMDGLFAAALASGRLARDPTLNIPLPPEEEVEEEEKSATTSYQVQIYSPDAQTYNFAFATLKVMPGVRGVRAASINIGGVSSAVATIEGDVGAARSTMAARGWTVDVIGPTIRISNGPFPSAPRPAPAQPPATPPAPQQQQ